MWRLVLAGLVFAGLAAGQPKRVLFLTHSAGYRHDSIPVAVSALTEIARADGRLEIVATEDVAMLSESTLRGFDAVLFFTSGELPVSAAQKQSLLEFVRSGKGFGGVHSATDTFYTWPEYGELIGARFNGHPWVQTVRLDVEDPGHPAVGHLTPGFSVLDEIYQFRDFSRERKRVLLTLDARSVDLRAAGVNGGTEDFPLAWCGRFGSGRTFYTALGHFDGVWRDARFGRMMLEALLWMTWLRDGESSVRPMARPSIAPEGVANSGSFQPRMAVSPGSLVTIFGANLTGGAEVAADGRQPPYKLAGTTVKLNGQAVPLLYAAPGQVNAYVPLEMTGADIEIEISANGGGPMGTAMARLTGLSSTPGIFAVTGTREWATVWATGLGAVEPSGGYQVTLLRPAARVGGVPARVLFSGLAPGWFGLYQVNVEIPPGTAFPAPLVVDFGGFSQTVTLQ